MTKTISPIKRMHTRDRRRFSAPTNTEVRCPFFDDTFFRMGMAYPADDMVAVCNDTQGSVPCDYRNTIVDGELCGCHRYWKESINSMKEIPADFMQSVDQLLDVKYDYQQDLSATKLLLSASMIFRDKEKDSVTITDFSRFPVYGTNNWRHGTNSISSVNNTSESMIIFSDSKINEATMIDYTIMVKGFVPRNVNDGDWVGIAFHHNRYSNDNYYLLQWGGGDNGYNDFLTLSHRSGNANTVLHTLPGVIWKHDTHYQYNINLVGKQIQVRIDDLTHNTVAAEFIYVHTNRPSLLDSGSFGVYASSQANATFYDLMFTMDRLITYVDDKRLKVEIPFPVSDLTGQGKTEPIEEYFQDVFEEWINTKPQNYEFKEILFQIGTTDNSHGLTIYFEDTQKTSTSNGKTPVIFRGVLVGQVHYHDLIDKNATASYVRTEQFNKPVIITSYVMTYSNVKVLDGFSLMAKSTEIIDIAEIWELEYKDKLTIYVAANDPIKYTYWPNRAKDIVRYFTGPSIDTHQKVFKLRANVLGWHANPIKGDVE